MVGDVALAGGGGAAVQAGLMLHDDVAQPLQPRRDQRGHLVGEDGQQPGEVVGVPVARHVRLAEPDQAAGADPAVERLGPHRAS